MEPKNTKSTTDHETIKKWAKSNSGKPAMLQNSKQTGRAGGLLRIVFAGDPKENLQTISWDQFFVIFDENNLKLVYTEEGKDSKFYKFENKHD